MDKSNRKSLPVLFFLLFWLSTCLLLPQEIMKLQEVKTGMTGTGKTIFKGTTIEQFDFQVLGILENTLGPGKHVIFVELFSPVLQESGVIAGMSGSPLYIDGKIIGAVAFGFNFAKKPIAGVTPIEDIIKTSDFNQPYYEVDLSGIEINFDPKTVQLVAGRIQAELGRRINYAPVQGMSPIRLLPNNRGMNGSALAFFDLFGTGSGMSAITGTSTNSSTSTGTGSGTGNGSPGVAALTPGTTAVGQVKDTTLDLKKDMFSIAPADAVAIPLIRGDFELSAAGTVTYVDGKKVYIFGHPLYNLGTVDFPLHKAEVITIFPSYASSFKVTATKHMIGAVVQDRFSAVQGELGRSPYMIPLKVFLTDRSRSFNIEIVDHSLLTPALSYISLLNIFSAEYHDFGFQSIDVKAKIFIENERNIIIEDIFSGPNCYDEFGGLLMAVNFFVMNNREKKVKIQKMDFEIKGVEAIKRSMIENVIIEKNTYKPGELINVRVYLKNERGSSEIEEATFKAPNLGAGTIFYLMVADRSEINKFENKNIKVPYFPNRLNPLIRAINNLRKNNRVYFKLMTETGGLYIEGTEYSNLPLSLQNVFEYNTASELQTKIKFSTLVEYQLEVPAVVQGSKLFKLKIKD